jgi:hypothetical protein
MKSKNNKENHRNCQNQGPRARFVKSKDSMTKVAIPTVKSKVIAFFSHYFGLARPDLLLDLDLFH